MWRERMTAMLSLREAAVLIAGAQIVGDVETSFTGVSTDSRAVQPGSLFVALQGEKFDGHDFLSDAVAQGAAAVMVQADKSGLANQIALPVLQVADTRQALGQLAQGWRRKFTLPLVAVVGSNGKTTVKEMLASIFAAAVGIEKRLATRGNLNNEIGLPLTLLQLNVAQKLAVVELGMNHPGETETLANFVKPSVALINNAQREHQEFMASVEAVAREHASVINALPADGVAVFPADDAYAPLWRAAAERYRVLDFALVEANRNENEVSAAAITGSLLAHGQLHLETPAGALDVLLRTLGEHNVRNALAASAAALAAGVPLAAIKQGLEAFEPVKGRLQIKRAVIEPLVGALVIDDTYNANPDSMRAAIDVLAAQPVPRVLVMGDMGEVGEHGPAFHREVGEYARQRGIDALLTLGQASRDACLAYGAQAQHFASVEALLAHLLDGTNEKKSKQPATLLIKGSRFMRMERVVEALVHLPKSATELGQRLEG